MSVHKVSTPFGEIDIELADGLVPNGYSVEWDDRPMLGAPTRYSPVIGFHDVPVCDGFALLPDGRTVASRENVVRVPYFVKVRRRRK